MDEPTASNGRPRAATGLDANRPSPGSDSTSTSTPASSAPATGRRQPLSPDAFRVRFAAEMGMSVGRVLPKARLREDLDLDSVRILELVLLLDDLGATVEDSEVGSLTSVEDVYRIYAERVSAADRVSDGASAYDVPTLVGRHTLQRPLLPGDDAFVEALMVSTQRRTSLRSFGASSVTRAVLLEHVVIALKSAARIGVISVHDADLREGTAFLELAFEPRVRGQGWPLEAVVLFIDHVFRTWQLRKLYAEVIGDVSDKIGSGVGRFFVEEGRFVAHEHVDGKLCDLRVLSFFREHWDAVAPRLLARIRPGH